MDEDDVMAAEAHQQELEAQYEQEQWLLRADPAFDEWLDQLELEYANDRLELTEL